MQQSFLILAEVLHSGIFHWQNESLSLTHGSSLLPVEGFDGWGFGFTGWGFGLTGWGFGLAGWGFGLTGWGFGLIGWGFGFISGTGLTGVGFEGCGWGLGSGFWVTGGWKCQIKLQCPDDF